MMKIFKIFILTIFIFNYSNILIANPKSNIIEEINSSDNLKFNFVQKSFNKEEKGICYLKRPYYLKCEYNDKNQKELIVNRKKLVIYHKRYKKIYNYPLSKSYFNEILNDKKFEEMINKGIIKKEENTFQINCFLKGKGEIVFYFNSENFDLKGWDLISFNNNKIIFKIHNSVKNPGIEKNFFNIPQIN